MTRKDNILESSFEFFFNLKIAPVVSALALVWLIMSNDVFPASILLLSKHDIV